MYTVNEQSVMHPRIPLPNEEPPPPKKPGQALPVIQLAGGFLFLSGGGFSGGCKDRSKPSWQTDLSAVCWNLLGRLLIQGVRSCPCSCICTQPTKQRLPLFSLSFSFSFSLFSAMRASRAAMSSPTSPAVALSACLDQMPKTTTGTPAGTWCVLGPGQWPGQSRT
jgi:hypothetical protein